MLARTLGLTALVALALSCSDDEREPVAASPEEAAAVARSDQTSLASLGNGFVVWESNRSGAWRIWTRRLDGSRLRQLSPDEPERDHFAAHISPDGTRIAYLSYPEGMNSYEGVTPDVPVELRVLDVQDGQERVVAEDAQSYGESRSVVWIDGNQLIYAARDRSSRKLDLRTGEATVLGEAPEGAYPYLLNATLTHGTDNGPVFSPYDPDAAVFAQAPRRGGCQAYFSRDGRLGFWTTRAGGPILAMDLASERSRTLIERDDPRLDESFRYVYFPMLSPDQRLLAWGASDGDHDHSRADYEIFVAPVDPMTVELEGDPVRYTFDPGVDRFPDVFLAGLEFGHLGGEAPFTILLNPEHVGPDHDVGEPWRWEFGDGATAVDPVGRHTYQEPGRYLVVARRDGRELHARVDVVAPAPPEVMRTLAREHEVRVVFDEPIDADAVVATLDSGIVPAGISVAPDRHTLRIAVDKPLPASDRLNLEGVRDRAGHAAPAFHLDVVRTSWPRDDAGLVFLFGTGADENRVREPRSGREVTYNLVSRGRARLDHAQALVLAGGAFEAQGAAAAIARACPDEDAITIEALIRPRSVSDRESGLIARLENAEGRWIFELSQRRSGLGIRLRTDESDPAVRVASLSSPDPVHLVVSYRDERLLSYRDGRKVLDTDRVQGKLSMMDEASLLLFGSASDGERDWPGTLEGIAIYCRFMEGEEAAANAHAYHERIAERKVVDRQKIRGRLIAVSDAPTLDEIAPYREGLTVYEWEVLRLLDGELGQDRVRVAHWAVLGGASQPIAFARPGDEQGLELELLSDHPQAAGAVLKDTLPINPDAPLFLDVGP